MKTVLSILMSCILFSFSIKEEANAQLIRPCIRVNNLSPTTGNPDSYKKCKNTYVQLSVINCGTLGNAVNPMLFTYTWQNITTMGFIYTSPTININEAGRWVVSISYTDIPSGITYADKDTLDLINFADVPIAINGNAATYSHCPYDVLTFTATNNSLIVSTSYKWHLNSTSTIDTNVTVSSAGSNSWITTLNVVKYITVSATDWNGCKIVDNIYAPLLPTPIPPNIGATYSKCPGKNITLTAAAQLGNTYSWDGGPYAATNTFTTSTPGKHWVTVQRGLGCKLADTTIISNYAIPTINIGNDTSLCYMESGNLFASVSGKPSYTYAWSPAANFSNPAIANPTISIVPITTINITVTVTDGNNCTNTASKNVTHLAQGSNPYLNIVTPDINICENTTKTFNTTAMPTYSTTLTYQWTPSTFLNDASISNPVVDLNGTGTSNITYSLRVTDSKGCYTTITPSATLVPAVVTSVGFSDSSVCAGNAITLLSSATGGTGALTYSWTPTSNLSTASIPNPVATVNQNQLYTLTVSDTKGCSDSKTVDLKAIIVKVSLTATDTVGYNTEPIVLNPDANSTTYNYAWTYWLYMQPHIAIENSKAITVNDSGYYKVVATDPISQCSASDSIYVTFTECNPRIIYVPNVFNPSSIEPQNQAVRIYGCGISEDNFTFKIFNKWGHMVYQTNSLVDVNNKESKGWNGELDGNGKSQSQSVYTYALHGRYFDGSEFDKTGSITLMR